MIDFNFNMPDQILFGSGKVSNLYKYIDRFGKNILVVADNEIVNTEKISSLISGLRNYGCDLNLVTTNEEPTDEFIEKLYIKLSVRKLDLVVSIGGSSSIDIAKIISVLLANNITIAQLINGKTLDNTLTFIPHIALPVINGGGSESTSRVIISNYSDEPHKIILKRPEFIPLLSIIDPEIVGDMDMNGFKIAALNTFSLLMQCYISKDSTSLTDMFMLEGLEYISNCLSSIASKCFSSYEIECLEYASLFAGLGIENSSLTIIEGLANAIGSLYNCERKDITAAITPKISSFNIGRVQFYDKNLDTTLKYAKVGSILTGIDYSFEKRDVLLKGLLNKLDSLYRTLEVPSLKDYGVVKDDFYRIITLTEHFGNPIELAESEIDSMLESCLK